MHSWTRICAREAIRAQTLMCKIADNTLCMMTHMLLTLEKRFGEHETMGNLFREERESLLMTTLRKRSLSIIERLLAALAEHLMIDIFGTMDRLAGGNTDTEKMIAIVNLLTEESAKAD